jgi:hypothetical protein
MYDILLGQEDCRTVRVEAWQAWRTAGSFPIYGSWERCYEIFLCRAQLRKMVDKYEKKYLFGRSIDDAKDSFALMCRECSFVKFLQALRAAAKEVRG